MEQFHFLQDPPMDYDRFLKEFEEFKKIEPKRNRRPDRYDYCEFLDYATILPLALENENYEEASELLDWLAHFALRYGEKYKCMVQYFMEDILKHENHQERG